MTTDSLVIAQLGLKPYAMKDETVIVTGAGGGIGYEAARALLWLGANVVIAEINEQAGKQAAEKLKTEFEPSRVLFVAANVGEEASVQELVNQSISQFGKVDIVINNATIAVLGTVQELPVEAWDASYRVNLRGPVLMARAFLPGMVKRKHGVFVCVSSTGTAYLGGYETFKAAQVHLANTLDAELEGTGVISYTIGPGLVPTDTATKAVEMLAPLMGMSVEEFFELNKSAVLSVEEAGAGFAASVVLAEKFKGSEISSMQALKAANINYGSNQENKIQITIAEDERSNALNLCKTVRTTLKEQADDWKRRSLFERQWVIRDFKKTAGMPVDEWLETLAGLEQCLDENGPVEPPPLSKLAGYYKHLADLAKGYEKDPIKLEENLHHVYGWKDDVEKLEKALTMVRL
jgi:NAD(P)-dependent dehydrogenase (short-subunit alcohol dehydrogenase family)